MAISVDEGIDMIQRLSYAGSGPVGRFFINQRRRRQGLPPIRSSE